jgi:hypothetical protein
LCHLLLFHLTSPPAPRRETAGLRSPASCDPVRERGNQVFGERSSATAGSSSIVAYNDDFSDDDFFSYIDHLLGDMTNSAPTSSSTTPYVFFSLLLGFASGLRLLSIGVDRMFVCYVPNCMTTYITLLLDSIIISIMVIMFYLPSFWIKLNGKLLKYSQHSSLHHNGHWLLGPLGLF